MRMRLAADQSDRHADAEQHQHRRTRGRPSNSSVSASSSPRPGLVTYAYALEHERKTQPMTRPGAPSANPACRPPARPSARTSTGDPSSRRADTAAAPNHASMVWLTAAAPIAFIGCTGNGVRYMARGDQGHAEGHEQAIGVHFSIET